MKLYSLFYLLIFVTSAKNDEDIPNELQALSEKIDHNQKVLEALIGRQTLGDLIGVMDFYKYRSTKIMVKYGVSSVNLTKHSTQFKWPDRIEKIRRINDQCWICPHTNEPIFRRQPTNSSKLPPWQASDNQKFYKWTVFVTTNPEEIGFTTSNTTKIIAYREFAQKLQTRLKNYYNSLPKEEKKKYSEDLNQFLLTFAAIIVRNYRLAIYFRHYVGARMHRTYFNGTKTISWSAKLKYLEPNWYFDEEFLKLTEILQKLSPLGDEYFYITGKFINNLKEEVIIPALRRDGPISPEISQQVIDKHIAQAEKFVARGLTETTTP